MWRHQDSPPRPTDTQCGLFASGKALRRYGVPFTYIENCWLDSEELERGIDQFIRIANVVRNFRGMRIGQIDVRPRQFLSVKCNESELLEKYGIEVTTINSAEIFGIIDHVLKKRPADIADVVHGGFCSRSNCATQTKDSLDKMAALQLAMLEIVERYDLAGIATECWELFEKAYGVRICSAAGNLSEMGIPVSCEADVHGVVSSVMLASAARDDGGCSFLADITQRHPTNENAELLWHCGPFPRKIAKNNTDPALISWHGQWELKGGIITLCRFDLAETGKYSIFADVCHGTDGPVTHGTYVWVEVDDWLKWERKFVEGPYIHHISGIHGNYAPIIKNACRYIPGLQFDCADLPIN